MKIKWIVSSFIAWLHSSSTVGWKGNQIYNKYKVNQMSSFCSSLAAHVLWKHSGLIIIWLWICKGGLHGQSMSRSVQRGDFVNGHGWTFWPSSRWGNAVGGGYGGLARKPAWPHTPLSCGPEILILFTRCICQSSHAEEQSCFLVVFRPHRHLSTQLHTPVLSDLLVKGSE